MKPFQTAICRCNNPIRFVGGKMWLHTTIVANHRGLPR